MQIDAEFLEITDFHFLNAKLIFIQIWCYCENIPILIYLKSYKSHISTLANITLSFPCVLVIYCNEKDKMQSVVYKSLD